MPEIEVQVGAKPMLLPPPEGHCRICGREHEPEMPHDALTVFYGIRFKLRYGRDGTWADAIAHCSPELRGHWEATLRRMGKWTEPPAGVETISEPIDG